MTRGLAADVAQLTLLFREPPTTAEALLDRLRELGLRDIARCRLTRNRNVMVSWRGDELRVHEGYLSAPDPVLAAIVAFFPAHWDPKLRIPRGQVVAAASIVSPKY